MTTKPLRRARSWWGKLTGYGHCERCGLAWNVAQPFFARNEGNSAGFFALCEECWWACTPTERANYARRLFDEKWHREDAREAIRAHYSDRRVHIHFPPVKGQPVIPFGRITVYGADDNGEYIEVAE